MNVIGLLFLATVFDYTPVDTSSICGYLWHRVVSIWKPSLSAYLCECPVGTFCPSDTLAASTPLTCTTAGSYCAKGSTATAPCPAGHYCPSPSSLVPCPAGICSVGSGLGVSFWLGHTSCVAFFLFSHCLWDDSLHPKSSP